MAEPIYPNVRVKLADMDGNAFAIVARTKSALVKAGYKMAAEEYSVEALSSDYDNVIQTTMKYVDVY